jgi:hypothetical protein
MNGLLARSCWPRCYVRGCEAPVERFVEVRLPASWSADGSGDDAVVLVGACRRDAIELERRQRALRCARRDLQALTRSLSVAVETTASLRLELEKAQARETSNGIAEAPRESALPAARGRGNGRYTHEAVL